MLHVAVSLGLSICATFSVGEHTFHHRELPNGLHAMAADDGDRSRTSVFVIYGVGNRMETSRTTGMAHLTEHALFTGTATTPAGQHDAKVKALGGESNAYTRDDFTAYYAHNFRPDALAEVLALEADRMRGLTWDEGAFLHERERLRVEEQHSYNGEVNLSGLRDLLVWDGRDYGAGVADEKGNTWGPELGLAQVRAFYDAWYHPRNAAVIVVGADPEQALDAIEAAFSKLAAGPKPGKRQGPPTIDGREETLELPLSRDRLEYLFMGPSLAFPEDRVALLLLAELLEGKKTPDGAPVSVWQGGRVGHDLFVFAATGDGAQSSLDAVYAEALAASFDAAALEKAKANLRDAFSSSPLRSRPYFSLAVDVAALASSGQIEWPEGFSARVDAVTVADLKRCANRWLNPKRRMTLTIEATGEVLPLPDDREGLKQAAEAAATSGDLDRAIAAYEKLLELKPGRIDLVIYRYTLGALNRDLGKLEVAREHLLAGLKVVEYPALRELLEKVEADMKAKGMQLPEAQEPADPHGGGANPHGGGANPHGGGANPHGTKPAKPPAPPTGAGTIPSSYKVVGTTGEDAPAWAAEGTQIMRDLERWRGLPFTSDLVVEFREPTPDGPAGWYEPDTKRLVVTLKGTERFGRGTMLHEMHHALQDQQFDLSAAHAKVEGDPDAERALQAVIEGEAMLAVQELMDYDFSRHTALPAEGELKEDRFEKVFHYGQGLQFVLAVRTAKGWDGVGELYRDIPQATSLILHPERYLEGGPEPAEAELPLLVLDRDEEVAESAVEGAQALRLFVARSPETRSRTAALAAAWRADKRFRLRTPQGERYEWQLSFDSPEAAYDFAAVAPRALLLLPELEGQRPARSSCEVYGSFVILRWQR